MGKIFLLTRSKESYTMGNRKRTSVRVGRKIVEELLRRIEKYHSYTVVAGSPNEKILFRAEYQHCFSNEMGELVLSNEYQRDWREGVPHEFISFSPLDKSDVHLTEGEGHCVTEFCMDGEQITIICE